MKGGMNNMPTVRSCEIVSRLKNDEGEVIFDLEKLPQILKEKDNILREYAYIIHNMDIYTEADESKNPEHKAGTLKPEHIHLLLRFERSQPQNTKYICKWFNIPENFVSKIHGKFEDAILYLIHLNAPDKFPYDISDITANFNVDTIIENAESKSKFQEIIMRILNGEIREYNKTLEIDNMLLVEPSTSRMIENAFKVRAEYLQATQTTRNTTCIYICGSAGVGKTTLAKKIADSKNLDYFVSSGSNDIMDGYCQQPCLILDDMRASSLGLSDLLKLLDPFTATSVKSRYKNKYLNCELIIITSVLPIEEFYHNVFEHENEPINQLKRRCKVYINVSADLINIRFWDDLNMRYSKPTIYINDLLLQFEMEKLSDTRSNKEKIEELLPFLAGKEVTLENDKATEKSEQITTADSSNSYPVLSDEDFQRLFKEQLD